jgi:hypothetical protein
MKFTTKNVSVKERHLQEYISKLYDMDREDLIFHLFENYVRSHKIDKKSLAYDEIARLVGARD